MLPKVHIKPKKASKLQIKVFQNWISYKIVHKGICLPPPLRCCARGLERLIWLKYFIVLKWKSAMIICIYFTLFLWTYTHYNKIFIILNFNYYQFFKKIRMFLSFGVNSKERMKRKREKKKILEACIYQRAVQSLLSREKRERASWTKRGMSLILLKCTIDIYSPFLPLSLS